jgi:hypothetical protein
MKWKLIQEHHPSPNLMAESVPTMLIVLIIFARKTIARHPTSCLMGSNVNCIDNANQELAHCLCVEDGLMEILAEISAIARAFCAMMAFVPPKGVTENPAMKTNNATLVFVFHWKLEAPAEPLETCYLMASLACTTANVTEDSATLRATATSLLMARVARQEFNVRVIIAILPENVGRDLLEFHAASPLIV